MKITIWALIFFISASSMFAEMVTGPLKSARLIYVAEEGTTVKKGDILCKFSVATCKNRIENEKIQIQISKAKLDDKKTDIKRAEDLYKKEAISLADREDAAVDYYKSWFAFKREKLTLEQMKLVLDAYVFKAPYDCKVVKNVICINSGIKYGTKIMEIEPLKGK